MFRFLHFPRSISQTIVYVTFEAQTEWTEGNLTVKIEVHTPKNTQQRHCSFYWVFRKVKLFSSFTDNTPPSFKDTCPRNMVFYAKECASRALLTWIEPIATDNSGHLSISYPGIRPPVNLSVGLCNETYSAIDSSGNRANCNFIVQVASKSLHLIVKLVQKLSQMLKELCHG